MKGTQLWTSKHEKDSVAKRNLLLKDSLSKLNIP
jgi:hypothetical protein